MRITQRRLAAVLCGLLALALLAAHASANRLSIGPVHGFRVASSSAEFLSGEVIEEEGHRKSVEYVIRCPMTLEGSFHSSTIAKVSGALIGMVTRAAVAEARCATVVRTYEEGVFEEAPSEGRLQVLTATLPWHVRYLSFSGSLPAITEIGLSVVGAHLRIFGLPGGAACLYVSSEASPMRYRATVEGGSLSRLLGDEASRRVPLIEGSPSCFSSGLGFQNAGAITQLNSTEALTMTLI